VRAECPVDESDVLKSFAIEGFAFTTLCRLVRDDPTVIDDESTRACDANASRLPTVRLLRALPGWFV